MRDRRVRVYVETSNTPMPPSIAPTLSLDRLQRPHFACYVAAPSLRLLFGGAVVHAIQFVVNQR